MPAFREPATWYVGSGRTGRRLSVPSWLLAVACVLAAAHATAPAQGNAQVPERRVVASATKARGASPGSPTASGVGSLATPAAAALGEVRGRVVDAGAELPLPAASLRIEGNGEARAATSSLDGGFSFVGLSPGAYTLVVMRASYRPSRLGVVVPEGAALVLDVQLTRLPVALQRVVVEAAPDSDADMLSAERVRGARVTDSRRAPRPVDLLSSQGSALSALAGVASGRRPTEPGDDRDGRTLFIWGAKDAGARVTLDGIALGAPLHLGGLLPVVDDDLMSAPRMWTAGAPARHDGGTDHVLDLTIRAATTDSARAWGTVDLLTARIGAEVPLGERGSALLGVRRVDDGALVRQAGVEPGYGYSDALARLQLAPATGHELRATLFATRERLGMPRDQGRDQARWGNGVGALAWEHLGATTRSLVRAGVSTASIDLPLLALADGSLRADAVRTSLLAERRWSAERSETSLGVEWERQAVQRLVTGDSSTAPGPSPSVLAPSVLAPSVLAPSVLAPSVLVPCAGNAACLGVNATARIAGQTAALYVDHQRALTPWLRLGAGARVGVAPGVAGGGEQVLLPRVALEALPLPGTSVRVSAGRYSRVATFFDAQGGGAERSSLGSAPLTDDPRAWMTRATATQLELGAAQRWHRSVLAVVAYWQQPGVTPIGQAVSRHRGMDASWRYAGEGASLSASYSRIVRRWTDAVVAMSSDSTWPAIPGARVEHLASLQGGMQWGRVTGTLGASYARGLSFASVVVERASPSASGSVGDAPEPLAGSTSRPAQDDYLRVDASLSARWCVGGPACRTRLAPYARVLNALNRRDAIFYYSGTPGGGANRLAGIPALVSLGVRVETARDNR